MEQKARDIEAQRASLESALRDSEARFAQHDETLATERSRWDSIRQELEQKAQDIEAQRASLESALRDSEARFARHDETLAAERSQWDSLRQELEQKAQETESQRAALESALRESEARFAQQADSFNTERSQCDALRNELEQKAQDIEAQRASLESALHDSEARLAKHSEDLKAERSQWDAIWLELEQKAQSAEAQQSKFESALHGAEARLAKQAETLLAERSQWDALRLELERKVQETESQRSALESALRDAEARLAQHAETLIAERSQWDTVRLDLERKHREAEGQRTSLQIAMEEVESYLSQQTEEHTSERSQWNLARLELEQKCLNHEEQQTALQNAIRQAEATLVSTVEQHNSECAQWNTARLELEQKHQILEQQLAELSSDLQESEARAAQLAEEEHNNAELLDAKLQQIAQLNADVQRLEADLAAMQLRHQELSRFSSAGMVLATLEGQVLKCNDAAMQLLGLTGIEEAQENAVRLYAFEGALKDRLQQSGKLENIEWATLTRDGRLIRILENARLIAAPAGEPPCVERILTDISKTHPLSAEIRHARRIESTTDLAAATVKSLQDLCASLAQCGARLKESAEDATLVREVAHTLLNDANRGVKHAGQFFSVTQKADRTHELLNLNEILAGNETVLRNLTGGDIDLQIALAPRIGLVSANSQELLQLISSLMASSREILPMGGTVSIETANAEIEPLASGHSAEMRAGTYVLLTVTAASWFVWWHHRDPIAAGRFSCYWDSPFSRTRSMLRLLL